MMKKTLMACFAAGIALAGIIGCSDDAPTQIVEGTQVLKFKIGDKFTYKVYNRDSANVNITHADSVKTEVWEVIDTGVTLANHTATVFLVTQQGATTQDTIYLDSQQSTGHLWQYDVLGNMVERIEVASAFAGTVPKQWVNISHTKAVGVEPLTASDALFTMTVPVAPPINSVTANVFLNLQPSHKGKLSTAVTAGDSSYTNVFHTDHALAVRAEATAPPLGEVLRDTLAIHYDVGINQGIIRQSLDSKTVTVTSLGELTVAGFERVLVSYERK